jgi:hypothetical protein
VLLGACPDLGQEDDIVFFRRGAHKHQLTGGIVPLHLGSLEELRNQLVAFADALAIGNVGRSER